MGVMVALCVVAGVMVGFVGFCFVVVTVTGVCTGAVVGLVED